MTASNAVLEQAALSIAAHRRIKSWITLTPCIPSRLSFDNDTELVFKADNFQKTGSFKFRGAMSKLTSLSTDVPAITASSGNHGLALATAAQITGHDLTVVLPETVAREKLYRIKALGVETILHSNDSGLAELHAQKLAEEQGKIYCSPYNDPQVIAGQGTIAIEMLEQLPRLDIVYVSIGGGGLISGIGAVLKAFSPSTRLVGVSAINSAALA
ncbi:MAG: threonine dehydratase, partial [Rhodobacteraceae bacterium]|nr:threonine dehydratase [Paracoccaceae bacterium]